jgi:hypothetical protein
MYLNLVYYNKINVMKRILSLLILVVFALGVNAQRGKIQTMPVDTLKGNNNDTLANIVVSGTYQSALLEVTCNKISAAAGGTLYLQGGLTAPQTLNESNSNVKFSINDTLTITDGLVWRVEIPKPADYRYYIYGAAIVFISVTF